jgi:hypothetical protein
MMLSLTLTLLLADNDVNDNNAVNDVNAINVVDDVNNANIDDADERRRQSTKERKSSRLDTSLNRAEQLMVCWFFAPLAASQARPKNLEKN